MAKHPDTDCSPGDHLQDHLPSRPAASPAEVEKASRIFRALGEPARLRLAARLAARPACVSELALAEAESITTISQRLRVLRADNIVGRERKGKHMLYYLADQHVANLVLDGLAHACEHNNPSPAPRRTEKDTSIMALDHEIHENHTHEHGTDCGHTAIQHDDHVDYLHDGHLHSPHEGHVDEHVLEVSQANPAGCTEGHDCSGHDAAHTHGSDCGHEAVPHGDHGDYLVDGHLHFPDGDHCDNHGEVTVVAK